MGWGVVQTQPNAERLALEHLRQQGYSCYLPRFREMSVVRGRKVVQEKILFRTYLFVEIADRWRSIFGTRGVSRLLMNGEKPAHIPESEILKLKASEDAGLIVLPKAKFATGERVKISAGQFTGCDAIYQGMSAQLREIVLMNILGRSTRVELAAGDLA